MGRQRFHAVGAAVLGVAALGALLAPACLDPTEVTLSITTDEPCAVAGQQGTQVIVGPQALMTSGTPTPAAETTMCTDPGGGQDKVIGTFVVTPTGDKSASFAVEVVLGVGHKVEDCAKYGYDQCIVARRRISFSPHSGLTVPIALRSVCLGVTCPSGYSCDEHGNCSSDQCADPSCTRLVDAGVVDALAPPQDTGGPDASADGGPTDAGQDTSVPPMDATVQDGTQDSGLDADACGPQLGFTCGSTTNCNVPTDGGHSCCGPLAAPSCNPPVCLSVAGDAGNASLGCLSDLDCIGLGGHCCAEVTMSTLVTTCQGGCTLAQWELCTPGCATCLVGTCQPLTAAANCPLWLRNVGSCPNANVFKCP